MIAQKMHSEVDQGLVQPILGRRLGENCKKAGVWAHESLAIAGCVPNCPIPQTLCWMDFGCE
jgi:hypothetical protein